MWCVQQKRVPFGCNACSFSSYSIKKYILHIKEEHFVTDTRAEINLRLMEKSPEAINSAGKFTTDKVNQSQSKNESKKKDVTKSITCNINQTISNEISQILPSCNLSSETFENEKVDEILEQSIEDQANVSSTKNNGCCSSHNAKKQSLQSRETCQPMESHSQTVNQDVHVTLRDSENNLQENICEADQLLNECDVIVSSEKNVSRSETVISNEKSVPGNKMDLDNCDASKNNAVEKVVADATTSNAVDLKKSLSASNQSFKVGIISDCEITSATQVKNVSKELEKVTKELKKSSFNQEKQCVNTKNLLTDVQEVPSSAENMSFDKAVEAPKNVSVDSEKVSCKRSRSSGNIEQPSLGCEKLQKDLNPSIEMPSVQKNVEKPMHISGDSEKTSGGINKLLENEEQLLTCAETLLTKSQKLPGSKEKESNQKEDDSQRDRMGNGNPLKKGIAGNANLVVPVLSRAKQTHTKQKSSSRLESILQSLKESQKTSQSRSSALNIDESNRTDSGDNVKSVAKDVIFHTNHKSHQAQTTAKDEHQMDGAPQKTLNPKTKNKQSTAGNHGHNSFSNNAVQTVSESAPVETFSVRSSAQTCVLTNSSSVVVAQSHSNILQTSKETCASTTIAQTAGASNVLQTLSERFGSQCPVSTAAWQTSNDRCSMETSPGGSTLQALSATLPFTKPSQVTKHKQVDRISSSGTPSNAMITFQQPVKLNLHLSNRPADLFHMLMERGIVTMPNTNIMQYIESSPETHSVLMNSFSKFPYPPVEEIFYLSNATKLSVSQIKSWFVGTRLRYGICWSPDEVMEAWSVVSGQGLAPAPQTPYMPLQHAPVAESMSNRNLPTVGQGGHHLVVNTDCGPQPLWMTCSCGLEHEVNKMQIDILNSICANSEKMPNSNSIIKAHQMTSLPMCAIKSFIKGKLEVNHKKSKALGKPKPRFGAQTGKETAGSSSIEKSKDVSTPVSSTKSADLKTASTDPEGLDVLHESFCIEPYLNATELQQIRLVTGMSKSAVKQYFVERRAAMQSKLRSLGVDPSLISIYEDHSVWIKDVAQSRSIHQQYINKTL